jgi:hypothetical protein
VGASSAHQRKRWQSVLFAVFLAIPILGQKTDSPFEEKKMQTIHTEQDRELVGILAGRIIEPGDTLVFYLYRRENGTHTVRIEEWQDAHPSSIILEKAKRWHCRGKYVTCTDVEPRWYYVQLDRRYPPSRLCVFNLPWAVFQGDSTEGRWQDAP